MRVLIIGHSGQDGTLLLKSLESSGHEVYGMSRYSFYPEAMVDLAVVSGNRDLQSIRDFIRFLQPTQIYYLAAHHTSSEGAGTDSLIDTYMYSHETHVLGFLNVLNAVEESIPNCRVFYAASSLVFSGMTGEVQNESTPLDPVGFYGLTKAQGILLSHEYRRQRGLFVSVGILYNHESPHRPAHFLSQKIVRAAARIAAGSDENLIVGDLTARVDWGYAGDYVLAFQKILELPTSDDFIVASGEAHSVQEFTERVFDGFGLDWRDHVEVNRDVLTRQFKVRIGDVAKLKSETGWTPSLDFFGLIDHLVSAEKARATSTLTQSSIKS